MLGFRCSSGRKTYIRLLKNFCAAAGTRFPLRRIFRAVFLMSPPCSSAISTPDSALYLFRFTVVPGPVSSCFPSGFPTFSAPAFAHPLTFFRLFPACVRGSLSVGAVCRVALSVFPCEKFGERCGNRAEVSVGMWVGIRRKGAENAVEIYGKIRLENAEEPDANCGTFRWKVRHFLR